MNCLEANFVARSGMEDAVSTELLRGHPFGGVSIAWSSDLDHVIRPISNHKHKHVVAVELNTELCKIFFLFRFICPISTLPKEKNVCLRQLMPYPWWSQ
jgi:hypothetical protein